MSTAFALSSADNRAEDRWDADADIFPGWVKSSNVLLLVISRSDISPCDPDFLESDCRAVAMDPAHRWSSSIPPRNDILANKEKTVSSTHTVICTRWLYGEGEWPGFLHQHLAQILVQRCHWVRAKFRSWTCCLYTDLKGACAAIDTACSSSLVVASRNGLRLIGGEHTLLLLWEWE